jgi:hypothetical protein
MNQEHTVTSYFPLWGVELETKEAVRLGEHITLEKPSLNEWGNIINMELILEYGKYHEESILGISPQPCLVLNILLEDGTLFEDVYDKYKEFIYSYIDDAVLTLRLLKKGWFMHPMFIEEVHIPNNGLKNFRTRRPYRQMFLAGLNNNFPEFYKLELSDLSPKTDLISHIFKISSLIKRYKESGLNQPAYTAIENFHLAYALPGHIESEQRLNFLFTALDAMLGGMSLRMDGKKWRLNNTEMTIFFKERLLEILKLSNTFDAEESANWMDTTIRKLRNKLAHGKKQSVTTESNEVYEQLLSIIRILLINFLQFSIRWNENRESIVNILNLDENLSLVESYNKVIELSFLGNISAKKILVEI